MKSIIHHLVAMALTMTASSAFVFPTRGPSSLSSALQMSKRLVITPEIEAAIVDVRAAAAEFGEETAYFANGQFFSVF